MAAAAASLRRRILGARPLLSRTASDVIGAPSEGHPLFAFSPRADRYDRRFAAMPQNPRKLEAAEIGASVSSTIRTTIDRATAVRLRPHSTRIVEDRCAQNLGPATIGFDNQDSRPSSRRLRYINSRCRGRVTLDLDRAPVIGAMRIDDRHPRPLPEPPAVSGTNRRLTAADRRPVCLLPDRSHRSGRGSPRPIRARTP